MRVNFPMFSSIRYITSFFSLKLCSSCFMATCSLSSSPPFCEKLTQRAQTLDDAFAYHIPLISLISSHAHFAFKSIGSFGQLQSLHQPSLSR